MAKHEEADCRNHHGGAPSGARAIRLRCPGRKSDLGADLSWSSVVPVFSNLRRAMHSAAELHFELRRANLRRPTPPRNWLQQQRGRQSS
jgi:hypothetical protein